MARGWDTQEKARSEIQRLTGWRIPQSVYAEWESGRRLPADANLARLEEFYGSTGAPEATQTPDALVAALMAQTAAITELVSELREARGLSQEVRERVAAVEAYAEEHERRLQADLLRGIGPVADSPLRSPQPAAGR